MPQAPSSSSTHPGFSYSVSGRMGHVILERPDAGNRVSLDMLAGITRILETASSDIHVLLISGAGSNFCMGRERPEQTNPLPPFDAFRPVARFYRALSEFPGLTVTAVQGEACGFGVGIALRSDISLAAADATFMLDEVPKGIPPMFVLSELVDHLHPKHLNDMVFLGRKVDADTALQMGIVSRVESVPGLLPAALAVARQLEQTDGALLAACKRYSQVIRATPKPARLDVALSEQTLFTVGR